MTESSHALKFKKGRIPHSISLSGSSSDICFPSVIPRNVDWGVIKEVVIIFFFSMFF